MNLEQQIYSALTGDATVSGFIGNRLYLIQLPQNPVYPCASFQRISTVPNYTTRPDPHVEQASVGWARFQYTVWSDDGANGGIIVENIAIAIKRVFDSSFNAYNGPLSPEEFPGCPNFLLSRKSEIEPQTQPPLYKAMLDFKHWYQDF